MAKGVAAVADSFGVVVEIRKGGKSASYRLTPLPPTGPSRAWRFRKVDAGGKARADERPYAVRQDSPGAPLRCDCLGHQTWGRCKHARVLAIILGLEVSAGQQVPGGRGEVPDGGLEEGVAGGVRAGAEPAVAGGALAGAGV